MISFTIICEPSPTFFQNPNDPFVWMTDSCEHYVPPLSSQSTPTRDRTGRLTGFRPAHITLQPSRRHLADMHNRVRAERITDGSDIRTTVMLRNVPNKMDWVIALAPSFPYIH